MAKLNAAAKPDAGITLTAQVEREIAAVAQKIRLNDLLTGAALLIVGTLTYAVVAILLDKWLTLPAWSRQLGFLGFLATILGLAYFVIIRPMTRTVNPRYVARRVEATMPESKNELINWVDLQEQSMATSVKSALADRAAAGFGDADVDSAVRSKKFLWLGVTAAVLVAVLAVLFLIFKGTQFGSLLSRAFNPFASTVIAARTTIDVVDPTELDATVADGEQIRFAVKLSGRVPDANAADKVRLKVRYSTDSKEAEEIPFAKTDTLRDFELILTRGTIQNGFWYTIAAGDAETAEHRVTVRTKPMIKGFEVNYEYPAYLRIAPSSNTDPKLRGYPGTKVRLQIQTNRDVKNGSMTIEPRGDVVEGQVVAEQNLSFAKSLDRPGQYRVAFGSTSGEASGSSIPYPIEILPDFSPILLIEKPKEAAITLPTNGLLEVDAIITDDFGIEDATLRFSVTGGLKIAGKNYGNEASFKREKDGTFPTRIDYKDSVKLDSLKDDVGKPVLLQAGQILEFWLEAKDNCTVLPHDVGKSKRYRVNLVAPPAKPEESKAQDQVAKDRQQKDQQHQRDEKNKRDNEARPAPQDPNQPGDKKNDVEGQPEQPKPNEPKVNPEQQPPGEKDVQDKAKELQNKIDEKNRQAGEAKENPNAEKNDGAEPPMAGEKKPGEPQGKDGQSNSESKPGEGTETDPVAKPAGENKEPGRVQPPETSQEKPQPNQKPGDETRPEAQPNGDSPKDAPKAEDKAGEEKKAPSEGMPKEQAKPGDKPKDNEAAGGKNEEPQKSEGKPQSGQAKRDGQPKPGEQKDAPKAEPAGADKPSPEERPADGKGQKPADTGSKKSEPKGSPPKDTGMEKASPEADLKPGEDAGADKGVGADPKDNNGQEKSAKSSGERKPTKEELDKLSQDAKDLNSAEPDKKKAAEEKLDQAVGRENREKLQEEMKNRAAADEKKLEEGAKQQGGKEPTKEELEKMKRDAKDLDSTDADKKKAAEQNLDKSVGKDKREQLQGEMDGRKGEDRKKLENDADQLPRDSKGTETQPKPPTKEDIDELAKKSKDLNSPDDSKKKDAEKNLDKSVGKPAREQMQKDMKDRDAAEQKKLEDAAKQEAEKAPGSTMKQPTKEELEKLAQDAKDLNSTDDAKKKAAEKNLDKAVGKDNREKLQDEMKKRDAAEKKSLEDTAKQQAQNQKPKEPTKEELDKLTQDAKDLNSTDEAKKKAAEQNLDQTVGKDNREKLQKDLKERDAAQAEADKKKLEDAAKQAAKAEADKTPGAKPKEPTKEEIDKLAQDAKDLDSPDTAKKKVAEDKVDQSIGKPGREQLQKEMKEAANDPKKQQEARDRLGKLAEDWRPGTGGSSENRDSKPLEENAANRLKAAELQLDNFKNYRGKKEFLKENNMTDADYEKFLKGLDESVQRQRKDIDEAKLNPRPTGPTSVGANDGSAGRVQGKPTATAGPGTAGPSFAPPGFSEAQRDFAKDAREALEESKKGKK